MQNLEVVQNGPAKFGLVCENALILTVLWQRKVMKICFKKLGLPKHFCDHGFLGNKIDPHYNLYKDKETETQ